MFHQPIVFAAFGTSTAAVNTYHHFEKLAAERFPDQEIIWSFTSSMLRNKQKEEGIHWESPEETIGRLSRRGCRRAVMQSLHIVPGGEYDKVTAAASEAPLRVTAGAPLLQNRHDCEKTIACLADLIPDPSERITVFAAHGTEHDGGSSMYREFERALVRRYPEHVYVGMVEGEPSWENTLEKIEASPLKKITFIPLMFVAGDHIMNDVMGDQDDSWKRALPGYDIEACMRGLGFHTGIADIYFEHLRRAIEISNGEGD